MQEITIRNLMTTKVVTAHTSTPLSDVVRTMKENRISCVIITDSERPVGIITEQDIVRLVADLVSNPAAFMQSVDKVMSKPLVTVNANTNFFEALVIVRSKKIQHLPVDDAQERLVGLVTQTDLVAAHFQVQKIIQRMLELSREDELLRIGNRRSMETDLKHTHAASCRYQRPYSVALFDVDYFKSFNEGYGRTAGDQALQRVTAYFKESIRAADRIYRYSGDKILLILPETIQNGAEALAQRLIRGIVDCGIPHEENPKKVLTISAGVCGRDQSGFNETWETILDEVNNALYEAKNQGRNCIGSAHQDDSFIDQGVLPFQGVISRQ